MFWCSQNHKEYVFNGFSLPSQLEEGEGMYVNLPGLETYVGFDIAVFLGTRRAHSVTLGGAISRLLGEKEASFSELHFLYSVPFW